MKSLDKKLISNNIKHLLEIKNIKISDFENELGISAGYITCIGNLNRKSEPTLSIIYNIADRLGVNIDLLLNENLTQINDDEQPCMSFLQRIQNYILSEKMRWALVSQGEFMDICMTTKGLYELIENNYEHSYKSKFENNTCLNLPPVFSIYEGKYIFLISVKVRRKVGFELYIHKDGKLEGVFRGIATESFLYDKMEEIYNLIVKSTRKNRISKSKLELLSSI